MYKAQLPHFFGGMGSRHFSYILVSASTPFRMCWSDLCARFPPNRLLFCVGSKRVHGVCVLGVSSHVARELRLSRTLLFRICLSARCFRFPTNRMLFWIGSKRVCGGRWGGVVACGAVCRLCYMLVSFLHWISHE